MPLTSNFINGIQEDPPTLRVPFHASEIRGCAFGAPVPRPACPVDTFNSEVALLFLRLAFGGSTRMQAVRVTSFTHNASDPFFASSLLGLYEAGGWDIGYPEFFLTAERDAKMRNGGATELFQPVLVFRSFPAAGPGLDFRRLYGLSAGLWFIIAAALVTMLAFQVFAGCVPGSLRRPARRLGRIARAFCSVGIGIALAVLSNYICLTFSEQTPRQQELSNLADFRRELASGRLTYLYSGDAIFIAALGLSAALAAHPPKAIDISQNTPTVLADVEGTFPKHAYASDPLIEALEVHLESSCELGYIHASDSSLPKTFYVQPYIHLPAFVFSEGFRYLYVAERSRIQDRYAARPGQCKVGGGGDFTLRVRQLYAVFWSLLGLVGLASAALCAEMCRERGLGSTIRALGLFGFVRWC